MSRSRRTSALLLTGLVLAIPGATGPAAVAAPGPGPTPVGVCQPGLGIGLTEAPSNATDPRATTYVVDSVRPGTRFERQFQVCNGTRSPITVQLYAGAATVGGGAFTVTEGRQGNELSGWVTVRPATVTVPPGERRRATAAFDVPAAAEPGERYGVLLAELPAQAGATGLPTASRVGVRIYLDVTGGAAARTDFDIESLAASRRADGTPIVTALVRNTGARAIDPAGALSLTEGPGGLSGGPFPATTGTTVGIGETSPVTVVLDKAIAGGPWLATLTLKAGAVERRERARVTFPDGVGTSAPPVETEDVPLAKDRSVLIPVAGGLIGLLLLLLLVAALLTSRKRAAARPAPG
ncbi:MAG: hypothetical protein Q8R60_11420 [Mycobacteriales bacterium]|nr:hypothetical protein [Mycobacteriales bacterium]